jgi:cystathionine beta-synthase
MQIHDSVLEAIGRTPLVRLSRLHPPGNLVAKVEHMNPGGSIKERIAVAMVDAAERDGLLGPGGTIIEPTSGNTGVGLALVGAVRGYRVICTVPDKVSAEKIRQLEAYGVEVIVTPTDLLPEDEDSYYGVARRLADEIDGAFHPNQYFNPANPDARPADRSMSSWRVWARAERSPASPGFSVHASPTSKSWERIPKDRSTPPDPKATSTSTSWRASVRTSTPTPSSWI